MARLLTLLTDFGLDDFYVGAVKGTVLRLAPGTQLVDLSHQVPAGDVEAAADLLAGAAPTFPAGTVHLAVVDPGVGSARRLLIVQWSGQQLVAPDNGLLTPQLEAGGEAWMVTRHDLFLDGPGATFHGRDRLAPIAAALLRGDHPNALGVPVSDGVRLAIPAPRREREGAGWVLHGRVARVDRFGNLVTDIPAAWLREMEQEAREGSAATPTKPGLRVVVGDHEVSRRVSHYAELAPGEPGALVGSRDTLELSLRGDSLAQCWGVARGAAIVVL